MQQLTPPVRLRREELASWLTAQGWPITTGTLRGKAHRGDGPPFVIFGRNALYDTAKALAWAEARVTSPKTHQAAA